MAERDAIDWEALSDDEFVAKAEMQIWLSAFANNNPRAPAHKETDNAFDEARRREKPWLYQKAYNKAVTSCGYRVSDADIARASPSFYAKNDEEEA